MYNLFCCAVQCVWLNPYEGCTKLQKANLHYVLTFHFTQERYNIIVTFLLVDLVFCVFVCLLFGVCLTHLFILRRRKRGKSSLIRSKRRCMLSMGMKRLLPGVHLAKSRIQGINEQPIAFCEKRWSTKFWWWLTSISVTADFHWIHNSYCILSFCFIFSLEFK